jgi:hypothetical protein
MELDNPQNLLANALKLTKEYLESANAHGRFSNTTVHIRHLCRKTAVLNCHRCLRNTGVEKINNY